MVERWKRTALIILKLVVTEFMEIYRSQTDYTNIHYYIFSKQTEIHIPGNYNVKQEDNSNISLQTIKPYDCVSVS
jgi:hypothetical protein